MYSRGCLLDQRWGLEGDGFLLEWRGGGGVKEEEEEEEEEVKLHSTID